MGEHFNKEKEFRVKDSRILTQNTSLMKQLLEKSITEFVLKFTKINYIFKQLGIEVVNTALGS